MTSPARQAETARFVAYSTLTRARVMAHADAAELLAMTRTIPALGYDNRFVEVLDCGAGGPDAASLSETLDEARDLYKTVFRGPGALGRPGMPAFALVDPSPVPPDRTATRALEEALSRLVDQARTIGHPRLASILGRALAEARAEIAGQDAEAAEAREGGRGSA